MGSQLAAALIVSFITNSGYQMGSQLQQGPPQGGGTTADGYGFGRSPMEIVATRWGVSCSCGINSI
jgi:hypothetical protein